MNVPSDKNFAYNLTDPAEFQQRVLDQSHKAPVLVDFWADWCGPCRMLAPVLDKVAAELGDSLSLVKIETDRQPELAARYQIRSLPTVLLFKNGEVVDQFMGAQSETFIRQMLSRHIVSELDLVVAQARAALDTGNRDHAEELLTKVLAAEPGNTAARISMAALLADRGETSAAEEQLKNVSNDARTSEPFVATRAAIELTKAVQKTDSEINPEILLQNIKTDPADLTSRQQLAILMIKDKRYEDALDQLLEILKRDRQYEEGFAHKIVLRIFERLGGKGDVVANYRPLLARALH